jgi:hypothetical protein
MRFETIGLLLAVGRFWSLLSTARGNDSYCDLLRLNHKFSEDFDAENVINHVRRYHTGI